MSKIIVIAALAAAALFAVPAIASASSSCYYSPRGCVSVSGYFKPSTGRYVMPYVRSYPSFRMPSFRTPTYRHYW